MFLASLFLLFCAMSDQPERDNQRLNQLLNGAMSEEKNNQEQLPSPEEGTGGVASHDLKIHRLLPQSAAFLAPVRFADTLYYGMSVDVTRVRDCEKNEVMVNIKSKYSEKLLKNWKARKNQNPLKTRVTVRQLKELITNHRLQCELQSKQNPDVINVAMDTEAALLPEETTNETCGGKSSGSILDRAMALTGLDASPQPAGSLCVSEPIILPVPKALCKKTNKKQLKKTSQAKNQKPIRQSMNEGIASLQIGTFKLDKNDSVIRFRVYWRRQCFVYELQTNKYYQTEGSLGPPEQIPLLTTIVINFHQISALHFKPTEMLIRLNSSPRFANGVLSVDPKKGCPIPEGYDITDGQSCLSLVHHLVFSRQRGAFVQHSLIDYNGGNTFYHLMTDEVSVVNSNNDWLNGNVQDCPQEGREEDTEQNGRIAQDTLDVFGEEQYWAHEPEGANNGEMLEAALGIVGAEEYESRVPIVFDEDFEDGDNQWEQDNSTRELHFTEL